MLYPIDTSYFPSQLFDESFETFGGFIIFFNLSSLMQWLLQCSRPTADCIIFVHIFERSNFFCYDCLRTFKLDFCCHKWLHRVYAASRASAGTTHHHAPSSRTCLLRAWCFVLLDVAGRRTRMHCMLHDYKQWCSSTGAATFPYWLTTGRLVG